MLKNQSLKLGTKITKGEPGNENLIVMEALLIHNILQDITQHLGPGRRLVVQAPPGAGKTTAIPLALLTQDWLAKKKILLLEPRRLAARAAAARMASLLGETVGETVGYRVRFDSKVSARTRIEVLTEGILTRRLQSDPELVGVGLVIFDEFHERHLHSDLALALCLDAQHALREDLALLVMSATLDGETIAKSLNTSSLVSTGRSWPVKTHYLQTGSEAPLVEVTAAAVRRALAETDGDILVFLPGAAEIRRVSELLTDISAEKYLLYGDLPLVEQQKAITPDPKGRRKIVLATNIAESSLTIEGISVVVDSGWARVPYFDANTALTRLQLMRISRAGAEQRKGRAGRLGPGICYRLWNEGTQRGLMPYADPEVLHADLAPLALELAQWGIDDVNSLHWLDTPPAGAMSQARELLTDLSAIDSRRQITALGREMVALPMHPRLSHMLLRARSLGLAGLACDIAALLSERDILRGPPHERSCEFTLRLEALQAYRQDGRVGAHRFAAEPQACAAVERVAKQWRHRFAVDLPGYAEIYACGILLALAYPDRVAASLGGDARYRLANGRGARLPVACSLQNAAYIVAAELGGSGDDSAIRTAAAITVLELEQINAERMVWQERIYWDDKTDGVVARRERRLGALLLASTPLERPDPEQLAKALLAGVQQMGLTALPWTEEARQVQARIASLRHWQPEDNWPDLSDDALLASLSNWLMPYLANMSRRSHLARLDMQAILRNTLDWGMTQRLDDEAPTHIQVPSGSRKRLNYTPGQPPMLAVKLQELFGLADTPRVGKGKVAVVLHLLSPAQRPIQVTQDLQGFWERTYNEVKKELKGRYPKHPWPDDPWKAIPTARTKPR
ncbi:MAG: ATP-dependent helicase HrpB [Thiohalomonadaceae bacterium]